MLHLLLAVSPLLAVSLPPTNHNAGACSCRCVTCHESTANLQICELLYWQTIAYKHTTDKNCCFDTRSGNFYIEKKGAKLRTARRSYAVFGRCVQPCQPSRGGSTLPAAKIVFQPCPRHATKQPPPICCGGLPDWRRSAGSPQPPHICIDRSPRAYGFSRHKPSTPYGAVRCARCYFLLTRCATHIPLPAQPVRRELAGFAASRYGNCPTQGKTNRIEKKKSLLEKVELLSVSLGSLKISNWHINKIEQFILNLFW